MSAVCSLPTLYFNEFKSSRFAVGRQNLNCAKNEQSQPLRLLKWIDLMVLEPFGVKSLGWSAMVKHMLGKEVNIVKNT